MGVITPHDNQVKEIQTVYYAVNNVRETTAKWKDILQVQVNPVEIHKEWNALCQSISLENMKVQFCEPKGEGLVQESLKQCGELPFAIEFKGSMNGKTLIKFLVVCIYISIMMKMDEIVKNYKNNWIGLML